MVGINLIISKVTINNCITFWVFKDKWCCFCFSVWVLTIVSWISVHIPLHYLVFELQKCFDNGVVEEVNDQVTGQDCQQLMWDACFAMDPIYQENNSHGQVEEQKKEGEYASGKKEISVLAWLLLILFLPEFWVMMFHCFITGNIRNKTRPVKVVDVTNKL